MRKAWPFFAIILLFCLLLVALRFWYPVSETAAPTDKSPADISRSEFLFCFWNVENFFDDKLDHRTGPGDREYDKWYAEHPDILKAKLAKLCDALLPLNEGRGPDILALAEVESIRAAELLQQALNARLRDPALHYQHVLMKEITAGRHIATAILTRLPVARARTRTLGSRLRILESHLDVSGKDLIVIASHWTSQLEADSESRRDKYADKIYGEANAIYRNNPAADILVCGDFNETPQAEAVTAHLHATADVRAVRGGDRLRFYNLMADKNPQRGFGTHFYRGWLIYDQILVAPGLLDEQGWTCLPDSVQVINTLTKPNDRQHRPWRFGSERDKGPRGYSDHFPVTVRLRVQPR